MMKFEKEDTMAMKGIAILLMLFHHCFLNEERWATVPFEKLAYQSKIEYIPITFAPFSKDTIVYLASFSKICVGIFVFLTGYGMAASYLGKKKTNDMSIYIKQRFLHLLSGFIIIFTIIQVLSIPTGRFAEVYGVGWKSIIFCLVDGLGVAKLFNTPLFCLTWWYMSLAVILILVFPYALKYMQSYGWLFITCILLIPYALDFPTTDLVRYSFGYLLGIICFTNNYLVKGKQYLLSGKLFLRILKFILFLTVFVFLIKLRQNAWIGPKFMSFWDGICPLAVILFSYSYLTEVALIKRSLSFLGKHSMNIFLIHSFYRDVFFHDFFYSFYYAWIDLAMLLIVSLLSSMLIEGFKSKIGYNRMVTFIDKKLTKVID